MDSKPEMVLSTLLLLEPDEWFPAWEMILLLETSGERRAQEADHLETSHLPSAPSQGTSPLRSQLIDSAASI